MHPYGSSALFFAFVISLARPEKVKVSPVFVKVTAIAGSSFLAVYIRFHLGGAAFADGYDKVGGVPQVPSPERFFQFRVGHEQPPCRIPFQDLDGIGKTQLRPAADKQVDMVRHDLHGEAVHPQGLHSIQQVVPGFFCDVACQDLPAVFCRPYDMVLQEVYTTSTMCNIIMFFKNSCFIHIYIIPCVII